MKRIHIIGLLTVVLILGMLFITWWSLWKWNDVVSVGLIVGNVGVFRDALALFAKELSEDNTNGEEHKP